MRAGCAVFHCDYLLTLCIANYSSQEKTKVLQSLKERAKLVAETFNSMDGIQCNEVMGAMYAFPQVFIPRKAQEEAKV